MIDKICAAHDAKKKKHDAIKVKTVTALLEKHNANRTLVKHYTQQANRHGISQTTLKDNTRQSADVCVHLVVVKVEAVCL